MAKSLTEQYIEGIIKEGEFWVVKKGCEPSTIYLFDSPATRRCIKAKRLKIIAPVPSYEEYKELKEDRDYFEKKMFERNCDINKLEQQLAIATKVMEHLQGFDSVSRALKEIEEVK